MTAAPPGAAIPAFTEARSCKDWLNALPLTNIPQAQSLVLESLHALDKGQLPGLERLKCLELMRDKIAFLQGEQRSRYFGKSLPLSANDEGAWAQGRALLEAMEAGYRACLEHARAGDAELAPHVALVSQRIARYLGAQMLFHAMVYRRFDPQLWMRLHGLFAEAEAAGIAADPVKDSLETEEGGSSVMEAYAHVVLVQAAYLAELTAHQIDFAEALLHAWMRKVAVRAPRTDGTESGSLPLVVALDKPIGARPVSAAQLTPAHRVVDTEGLSRSLRKRIHALRGGDEAAKAGLPPQAMSVDPLQQLQRLHRLWCEGAPPRPPARVPEEKSAGLVFGAAEIHFFLSGGKPFEQPGQSRELTPQEKQDIEVFGRITERTQGRMQVEHRYLTEAWEVVDEMLGAWRLRRPPSASRGVAIGRLVAMRLADGAPFFLGHSSALAQETDGRIVMTVTLFPGRPEPVAVRPVDRGRASAKWSEGFRLPALEKLRVPASLVVPGGVALRGRPVEIWQGGAQEFAVQDVLDRGSDFDRVTLG